MKYLVLSETFMPLNQPTAKCLMQFISQDKDNYFFIISKGVKNIVESGDNFKNIQINSFYEKPKKLFKIIEWFMYKVCQKVFSFFKPYSLFDSNRFIKASKKIFNVEKIDRIIAISGWFSTQVAGSYLSGKYNRPFISWYTDPFLYNIKHLKYKENLLKKIEQRWLFKAKFILMPSNYKCLYDNAYVSLKDKFVTIELPCLFTDECQFIVNHPKKLEGIVIHSGYIQSRIKNVNWFFSFVKTINDFTFVSLEDNNNFYKNNKMPDNLKRIDRLQNPEYAEFYSLAAAILVIDNIVGIQIPSKAIEAISSNKPIIFIYYSEESPTYKMMKYCGNVFFVKESSLVDEITISNLKSYINRKTYSRKLPYSNTGEVKKIINLLHFN